MKPARASERTTAATRCTAMPRSTCPRSSGKRRASQKMATVVNAQRYGVQQAGPQDDQPRHLPPAQRRLHVALVGQEQSEDCPRGENERRLQPESAVPLLRTHQRAAHTSASCDAGLSYRKGRGRSSAPAVRT